MSNYPIRYYKKSHHYDDDMNQHRDREAFTLILEGGAIEGWRSSASEAMRAIAPTGYYGGVEIHSRTPLFDGHEQAEFHCDLIMGRCYHDGSSMAFDQIASLFNSPGAMFSALRMWEPDEWREEA